MSKPTPATPARILRLRAENIKKIVVVDFEPSAGVVEIAGKNGNGKTSVLDAIMWAIAGKRTIQWKPIRAGEEQAKIVLEIGDDSGLAFRVTRKFKLKDDPANEGYTTSLVVEAADGNKPDGPQELLQALLGKLSIDPVEFARASGSERVDMVKALVPDFSFDDHEAELKRLADLRLDAGREAKRLKGVADTFVTDPSLPKVIVNTATITAEFEEAQRVAKANADARADRERLRLGADELRRSAANRREEAETLRRRAAEADAAADAFEARAKETDSRLSAAAPIPDDPDVAAIRAKLDETLALNRRIEREAEGRAARKAADDQQQEWHRLDDLMTREEAIIRQAIVDANLPVRGLTFTRDDVFLDGVPFAQASDAQQVRASLAIAMALKPTLRVIRIRDGSLLDSDAMAILREVADATGFQIWIERVQADDEKTAIILQDGMVRE